MVMISLKKTAPPCSYSGAYAAYDVLKDVVKVGSLLPKTSRLSDGENNHELKDINNKTISICIAVRGTFRKNLNKWAESQ